MPTPTNERELRNLATMWELQAEEIEFPTEIPMVEEEITEGDSNTAETLRHCAGELRTLLDQGYVTSTNGGSNHVRA